ncbi:16S rRNA methyltransferase [Kiloniella litopenaei]|uniref:Ribosomal RNA small subunit methyltransferase E n=1 Tax=Kiloniella litopenaei TaxID=1549748 RepID=A0A0M2RDZ2_9PROT|nr:16S rRNA (uracil(1498)-N(3))-methyltransferase [Kiloniella litopenaei]KKJ77778.1 16S rRNA methyltransferase [Kiloniella litopenaei]
MERVVTRLYVEDSLSQGATVGLDAAGAHYLRSVLRLNTGARIGLFNEKDGEWLGVIEGLGKGWCSLQIEEQRRKPTPEPDIWLVFAPIKRSRIDFLAEKAGELGCSRILPVFTRYTDVKRINRDRLAAHAKESAEQCERLSVTTVDDAVTLDKLIEKWPDDRRLIVCAEFGDAKPIAEMLTEILVKEPDAGQRPWAVLIGPEGGFAEEELEALRRLPYVTPIGLGPRVLRADTAAVAALSCWQAILGDGGMRPPKGTTPVTVA